MVRGIITNSFIFRWLEVSSDGKKKGGGGGERYMYGGSNL
jgi:hypothetical protein